DQVDTQVQDRAAAQFVGEHSVGWIEVADYTEIGLHRTDLADSPVCEQFAGFDHCRLEAGPHGLHREHLMCADFLDQRLRASEGGGECLLDQHGLASAGGFETD